MEGEEEDDRYFDAQQSGSELARVMGMGHINSGPAADWDKLDIVTGSIALARRNIEASPVAKSHHRRSYQETVPAIPAIPAKYLQHGQRASICVITRTQSSDDAPVPTASQRGSEVTATRERFEEENRGRSARPASQSRRVDTRDFGQQAQPLASDDWLGRAKRSASLHGSSLRRRSLHLFGASHTPEEAQAANATDEVMSGMARGNEKDLFMELARGHDKSAEEPQRSMSRGGRALSRLSQAGHRRSLPAEAILTSPADRRPKSSGTGLPRPGSRLEALQNNASQYRSGNDRTSLLSASSVNVSGRSTSVRANRSFTTHGGIISSAASEDARSPDMPSFGRRRPSYGPQGVYERSTESASKALERLSDSPAASSEAKLSNGASTASVDSDTADTVWDELDELKSRIKKLELTGKLPGSSGAAVSGVTSERPRSATTAPTTIESSPKIERKPDTETRSTQQAVEITAFGPGVTSIHPLLHSALAKAKPLLHTPLYRSLEATAADALQLAALTGSAGPQGTTFSAASIINGLTVSDRHVRRKADSMCRNLTDLTLALCEGKHEASSVLASPITLDSSSPTIRHPRSTLGRAESIERDISRSRSRPFSRLEARRSSILGIGANGSINGESSLEEGEDAPGTTPSAPSDHRRLSRAGSRLLSVRSTRNGSVSGDEGSIVRPPSRAVTEAGGFRLRSNAPQEYSSLSPGQDSSPSFRESLAARRNNGSAFESNRELGRVASLNLNSERRRWTKESTPPVLEEESNGRDEPTPSSQPRRRITSMGHFGSRRVDDHTNRTSSLSQRRSVVVE
ncbi:hypothetical protein LTR62_007860 [Meristemomyces frigidus]|uniref:Uncharacterized protein n=1 Tax=Meristemomyces frigidus TaxID=1508187 RepID=A0AAN7TB94_9PEZI|nr:hypothetical protein LTR62_007860 [Meristemomyces frigidus]